jgi:hypothetical protein
MIFDGVARHSPQLAKSETELPASHNGIPGFASQTGSEEPLVHVNLEQGRMRTYGLPSAPHTATPADAFFPYFSVLPMIRVAEKVLPKSTDTSSPANFMMKV